MHAADGQQLLPDRTAPMGDHPHHHLIYHQVQRSACQVLAGQAAVLAGQPLHHSVRHRADCTVHQNGVFSPPEFDRTQLQLFLIEFMGNTNVAVSEEYNKYSARIKSGAC